MARDSALTGTEAGTKMRAIRASGNLNGSSLPTYLPIVAVVIPSRELSRQLGRELCIPTESARAPISQSEPAVASAAASPTFQWTILTTPVGWRGSILTCLELRCFVDPLMLTPKLVFLSFDM